jgi:hypothetical protein
MRSSLFSDVAQLVIDILAQPIGPTTVRQAVQEEDCSNL